MRRRTSGLYEVCEQNARLFLDDDGREFVPPRVNERPRENRIKLKIGLHNSFTKCRESKNNLRLLVLHSKRKTNIKNAKDRGLIRRSKNRHKREVKTARKSTVNRKGLHPLDQ